MRQSTKEALAEAFRSLLRERSIDKITVKDVVARCGVNRQTFYYYFSDIFDLFDWMLNQELDRFTREHPVPKEDWEENIRTVFRFVQENRVLILHGYDASNRAQYERFLLRWFSPILQARIESYPQTKYVPEEKRQFITRMYTWACMSLLFDWVEKGLPQEKIRLDDLFILVDGSLGVALDKFRAE